MLCCWKQLFSLCVPWGSAVGCEQWAVSEGSSPLGALRWPQLWRWALQQPGQCKAIYLLFPWASPPVPTGCPWGAVLLPTGSDRAVAALLQPVHHSCSQIGHLTRHNPPMTAFINGWITKFSTPSYQKSDEGLPEFSRSVNIPQILSKYFFPAAYRPCCPTDAYNSLLAWGKHTH